MYVTQIIIVKIKQNNFTFTYSNTTSTSTNNNKNNINTYKRPLWQKLKWNFVRYEFKSKNKKTTAIVMYPTYEKHVESSVRQQTNLLMRGWGRDFDSARATFFRTILTSTHKLYHNIPYPSPTLVRIQSVLVKALLLLS